MPKIFKASTVYIDQDNKVQIKADVDVPESMKIVEETIDITSGDPEELAGNIVENAKNEAAAILGKAIKDSEAMLKKAEKDSEILMAETRIRLEEEGRQIREENRNEGFRKGMDEAEAVGVTIKGEAQSVLNAAVQERNEMREALEPDAVNLIINIVEKLLGDAVKVNPAVIVSLIRKGFAETTLTGQVVIRVSEADYPRVMDSMEELMAAAGGTAELEVVKDLSLGSADCIIDTPFGGIDVSLTPQFESLKENLIFLMEHNP